jgi:hypothetical protein
MWRLLLVVVLLTAGCTASLAQKHQVRNYSFCDENKRPPPEYDFEPNQAYEVAPVSDVKLLRSICNYMWVPVNLFGGCVLMDEDPPRILFRADLTDGERECLMRHERAHINGWVHPIDTSSPTPRGPFRSLPKYTPAP